MYKKINRNMRFIAVFTLIISTSFILAACYSMFTNRLKSEIKDSAFILADILNAGDNDLQIINSLKSLNRRVTLISPEGDVIFDSDKNVEMHENHSRRPEVISAVSNGFGDAVRYSSTLSSTVYYYAIRLDNGSIIRAAAPMQSILITLITISIPTIIIAFLIYLLSVIISVRLTDNIVNPIEKSYSFDRENYDNVYEELRPFLERIAKQNKEIRKNLEEIKRAEKIRREFSANVSHELKTPLTSIKGYSQLINSSMARAEDIPEFTLKIEKEASRLITLVDDIIELSHLDETESVEQSKINLGTAASECAERLSDAAEKRGIKIILNNADAYAFASPYQIDELLYNLIDNAVKYNRDNGTVTITIGVNENNNSFISVCDTGIGIPDEYLDRIFERFFRVDKSHSKKINGTGLGLSIVKHIAILNNAELKVKSKIGEGSEFTVIFK